MKQARNQLLSLTIERFSKTNTNGRVSTEYTLRTPYNQPEYLYFIQYEREIDIDFENDE